MSNFGDINNDNKISYGDLCTVENQLEQLFAPLHDITEDTHEEQPEQSNVVSFEDEDENNYQALSSRLPAYAYGNSDQPTRAGYSPNLVQETQSEDEVEDVQSSFVGVVFEQNSQHHVRERTNIDLVKQYWLNAYFKMVIRGEKNKKKAAFEISRSSIAFGHSEKVILTYLYNFNKNKKFLAAVKRHSCN